MLLAHRNRTHTDTHALEYRAGLQLIFAKFLRRRVSVLLIGEHASLKFTILYLVAFFVSAGSWLVWPIGTGRWCSSTGRWLNSSGRLLNSTGRWFNSSGRWLLVHIAREAELVDTTFVHLIDPSLVQENEEDNICTGEGKREETKRLAHGQMEGAPRST